MTYAALRAELSADPLARGYAAMTDAEAAASFNTVNRTVNRDSMSGDEVFAATNGTEFGALTDAKKAQWLAFCGRQSIAPFGAANVAFVTYIFGSPSTTLTALGAARTRSVSRAEEIGFGVVKPGDVANARVY